MFSNFHLDGVCQLSNPKLFITASVDEFIFISLLDLTNKLDKSTIVI